MRVTKNANGQFVVEDGPMRLEGKAAREFMAQMRERDATGNDADRQRLLAECAQIFENTRR